MGPDSKSAVIIHYRTILTSSLPLQNLSMRDCKVGDYYLSQNELGSGSYSRVYLGQHLDGHKAAIKVVKKTTKILEPLKFAEREAKILTNLKSPLVCSLLATHESENHFFLIEAYQEGETLSKCLARKKRLSTQQGLNIFCLMLESFEYLFSERIMHRDVKPDNLIITHNRIVIIDFGFACKVSVDDSRVLTENVGTPIYMSPELLKNERYNSKSDIWSIGVIFYEMLYGPLPYWDSSEVKMLKKLQRELTFDSRVSVPSQFKILIRECLRQDIDERISWRELFVWGKRLSQTDYSTAECCLGCW